LLNAAAQTPAAASAAIGIAAEVSPVLGLSDLLVVFDADFDPDLEAVVVVTADLFVVDVVEVVTGFVSISKL
jgi:hypothetical protein